MVSLSPRERAGVRGNEMSSSASRLVAARDCCHRAAIIRQRTRRPCLQCLPDCFTYSVSLASQPRIPETQHLNAARFEPRIAVCIGFLFIGLSVLQTVEFDVEKRFDTEEVQDVWAKGMLSAKFVCRKTSVAQPTPEKLLSPSIALAQGTCDRGGFCVLHGSELN